MPVSLTLSSTSNGTSMDEPLDYGNKPNGQTTSTQTIYIRHDGAASITDVGFYIDTYSGAYSGDATAAADYAELKAWGDATTASTFGGLQINQNAINNFPAASWPSVTNKVTADTYGAVFTSTNGSTSLDTIDLLGAVVGAGSAGEIAEDEVDVRFQTRIQVPTDEDVVGVRLFDFVIIFSYTS